MPVSTSIASPPSYLQPYAQNFIRDVWGNVSTDLGQGYPSGLNQQVAPFTPDQMQAMQMGQGFYPGIMGMAQALTPQAQGLTDLGASQMARFSQGGLMPSWSSVSGGPGAVDPNLQAYASGKMMAPNPYLNQYYNQAALNDTSQFKLATDPALMAQAQQAGAFNSSGFAQEQGLAQQGLGQSLATLGANIYEPAYQQESANRLAAAQGLEQNNMLGAQLGLQGQMANQSTGLNAQEFGLGQRFSAAQGLPGMAQAMYAPLQAEAQLGSGAISGLYGIGGMQQQQQQNMYNAAQANAAQQLNYPFAILSQLGGALGQAAMGGGTSQTYSPNVGSSGGFK